MKAAVPELERRRLATVATLARYRGKVFDWREGVSCVHLARFHLRNMGHRPPTLPRIRSALAARRALKERGWPSVVDMLDSLLPRIAPAAMTLGDLAAFPGDAGLHGIVIFAAPRKVFGWREDEPALVLLDVHLGEMIGAWRA